MSDRQKISRKKGNASNYSNPSLAPKIPRLAIPAHSDVESNNITAKTVESETSQEQALVTEELENQENISLKSDSTIESFNYLDKISIFRPQETVQRRELAEEKQEQSEVVQRKLRASKLEDKQEELSPLSKAFQIQGNQENKLDSPIESFNYLEKASINRPRITVQDGNLQPQSILQTIQRKPEKGEDGVIKDSVTGIILEKVDKGAYLVKSGKLKGTKVRYDFDDNYYYTEDKDYNQTKVTLSDQEVEEEAAEEQGGIIEAGEGGALVMRPEKDFVGMRISGLIQCVGIVIEAKVDGKVAAAAGGHFVTPTSISDDSINDKGTEMITGLKNSVSKFGELSALTIVALGKMEGAEKSGDYQAGVAAVKLIKDALGMDVDSQTGNSQAVYKLYCNGNSTLE